MKRSEDWKIGARRMIKRDPELRAEMLQEIRESLATDDAEERHISCVMARDLLELEFETEAELLAQLRESAIA